MFSSRLNKRSNVMTVPDPRLDSIKQENIRLSLTKELETVVKAAISSPYSSKENIPSEVTQNLCNSIEAIFIHGLKDPFFLKGTRYAKYPEPNFWPFVSKYSHKNVTNQIAALKQIKTEIGKSRAWIRIVLNENSLSHYLDLLAAEKSSIHQFYGEEAFLRYLGDNEYSEQIRGILKPLTALPVYAATNSSFLNSWTPTPLILAGLMDGKPLKVGALKPRRNPRSGSESEEIAVSALDMLVPEEDHDIGSPNRMTRRRVFSKTMQNSDEEDSSSVYSHPSMLGTGEMNYQHALAIHRNGASSSRLRTSTSDHYLQLPQSPLFTSTPVEKTILDNVKQDEHRNFVAGPVPVVSKQITDEPQSFAPLIVSRRTRRPSKSNSRSSSGSISRDSARICSEIAESSRASRSNSELPSTIFGTVPHDIEFSVGDSIITNTEFNSEDFGIPASDDRREVDESESLIDVVNQLATSPDLSTSNSYFDPSMNVAKEDGGNILDRERSDTIEEEDVFNVDIDPPQSMPNEESEIQCFGEGTLPETHTKPINKCVTDSIFGTSLRDEFLEVGSATSENFDNGVPIYVQSPAVMGNSLAAIGARNNWESMSERSRLSSSSDSCGPAVSFGQALRSAMNENAENEFDRSNCTSNTDLIDHEDSVVSSSCCSRKSSKCSSSITMEITERLCRVPREKGLDAQDFRCSMCRKSIGGSTYSKFEACAIDGKYYCVECMKNGGKTAIPARVLMDWDWRERAISDRGRAWLDAHQEKPLINVEMYNPEIYSHITAMQETKVLREKLQLASMYLFTCRESVAEDFRRRVWPKEYLYSDIQKYSFSDLIDIKTGALQKKLSQLLKHATTHVMNCVLCRQKGFICELCSVNDVIYPFQTEDTHRCGVCFSVFHKYCWKASGECPKCIRRKQFEERRAEIDVPQLFQP